jgi:hypothetical protein
VKVEVRKAVVVGDSLYMDAKSAARAMANQMFWRVYYRRVKRYGGYGGSRMFANQTRTLRRYTKRLTPYFVSILKV